jgi:hypothetical protein
LINLTHRKKGSRVIAKKTCRTFACRQVLLRSRSSQIFLRFVGCEGKIAKHKADSRGWNLTIQTWEGPLMRIRSFQNLTPNVLHAEPKEALVRVKVIFVARESWRSGYAQGTD